MIVTLTSIRLKSVWHFFKLSWFGFKISKQAKLQTGFIQLKNTGFAYLHFTCSAWQNENAMKEFARSGAHLEAMKNSASLAEEIRTYTYETDHLPTWQEVKVLLFEKGKALHFR
jgi:hypothetical protein